MIRMITQESVDMIIHFEGVYLSPYLDPVNIPTIGIGTIKYENGNSVSMKDPSITEEEAMDLLIFELTDKANTINKFLIDNAISLNDQQYSSLVSFSYNCGCGPIIEKGRTLHDAIITKDVKKMADAFLVYNKATKKYGPFSKSVVLPGLARRRKAERYLFMYGKNNFFEDAQPVT